MFSVSMIGADGVTYSIGAYGLEEFAAAYDEANGLHGLASKVSELDQAIAERSVAPIAAADQAAPVTTPGVSDELADLIRGAPDLRALSALYKANKAAWNGDYNKLAGERRKQLEKAAAK